ncbi:hypothetical protein AB0C76_10795 [Kitasatospora sp. NPDC048722]|uniref:hypothetical protein n=1 Tax=Kitasatospora sp. NPDC048722 TaxID=3155639 RepID=UPI0033E56408
MTDQLTTSGLPSDPLFIAYMTVFQTAAEHLLACEECQAARPCPVGDPLHADFLAKQAAWENQQYRKARNERRRAQRKAEARSRMARHAAGLLVTFGPWKDGRPAATPADVARQANAMYGGYLKGEPITTTEGAAALEAVLNH